MKCCHCGREISDDAKFCVYCGKPQMMPGAPEAPGSGYPMGYPAPMPIAKPKKKKNVVPIVILSVLGAILLILLSALIALNVLRSKKPVAPVVYEEEEEESSRKHKEESEESSKETEKEETVSLPSETSSEIAEASEVAEDPVPVEKPEEEPTEESLEEVIVPLTAEVFWGRVPSGTKLTAIGVDFSSEFYWAEGGSYFAAANLIDGDINTNWQEDNDGDGTPVPAIGEWATLNFAEEVEIASLEVWLGYASSDWGYYANSRPSDLTISFDNGESVSVHFNDAKDWQHVILSRSVKTKSVTILIDDVYLGSEWPDTAISEIVCYSN